MRNPGECPVFAYRLTPFMKKGGVRMWTKDRLLKNRAKMCLSRYYLGAFCGESDLYDPRSGFGGSECKTHAGDAKATWSRMRRKSRDDQSGLLIGELGGDGSPNVRKYQSGRPRQRDRALSLDLADAYGPGAGNAGSMVASNLFYRLSRERWSLL